MEKKRIKERLGKQHIETPSWGYADSGTRFKVFPQAGAARSLEERLEDAAQVHRYTGICPSVALHIPWDRTDDWNGAKKYAADLGLSIGAINPNLFQEPQYMLGSICHPSAEVRRQAEQHILECIEIARITGSADISLWLGDGTNYPGQDSFRERKQRMERSLTRVCDALPEHMRLLIEYKFFEPAFYHTDIGDWGIAYLLARKLGEQAQVLVDLGHHPLGTNVEQIVAILIDEGKLGGFHFNNKKFADDDLTVGSINPYELFLIYNELAAAEVDADTEEEAARIAYMIDQSHNVKNKIEAMIQSVMMLQECYAKALLVDREALQAARRAGGIIDAEECLKDAFATDVRPLLRELRADMGLDADPLAAFRAGGYQKRIEAKRVR